MSNLKNVIYLSNEDYELLLTNGSVTINGTTLTYDENDIYITPDVLASQTENGLMSAEDKVKLDNIQPGTYITTDMLSSAMANKADKDHTHDSYVIKSPTTITEGKSTDTNELNLSHGAKYSINAAGDSFIFTMPPSPTVPTKTSDLTNDSGFITGVSWEQVTDKPTFATVATSGSYNDLEDKPTIPTVPTALKNPNSLTIKANSDSTGLVVYDGSTAKTFIIKPSTTAGAFIISDGTTEKTIQLAGKFTDNNTTYTFATGDSNGQIKVTPSGGTAQNISVKGLGNAAYTDSSAYAAASHTHDDRYYTESEIDTKLAGKANSSHTHDYLGKTTYEWNKEFAAGSNGAISLGRYNMYDTQLTFDIDSTTTTAMSGKLVIATQNGRICEAKVFGDAANTLVPCLQIYQSAISNQRSYIEVFCNFPGWSKNKVHIYGVALNSATVEKQMTSVTITDGVVSSSNITSGDTKWTGTIVNAITSTVAPISHGTHVTATTVKSALGTGTGTSKYLREDGTWVTPPNTQNAAYGNITTSGTITSTAVTSATGVLVYDSNNKIQRATAANARAIIGAGTSNLAIGTTSSTAAAGNHNHSGVYQPVDADLTAIAGLTGTSGLLKKTAANTWALDTNTYLTSVPNLAASKITSGTFDAARIPAATSSAIGGVKTSTGITNSSGTISVTYGTTEGTACQGNDSRLSDSRTPKSHTHGSITNDGKLGTASRVVVTDGSKNITVSSSITTTELGYLDGVTSNIQTQLNAKQDKVTFTYNSTTKELTIE